MNDSEKASIAARNVSVVFPIYGSKSLKSMALKRATNVLSGKLGGNINVGQHNNVYIEALTDVSLDIGHGERVGVVGHNGSGKSTLLRVLAGVYEPVSGTLNVVGRAAPFLDLSMGMDPDMTGYENIRLRGLLLGLSNKQIADQTEEIAAFSELEAYLEMPMRTYSSGMLMRLAFAVSTIVSPDILLMDEWVSVGDESFQHKAQERLRDVVRRSKILILASHSMDLIRSVCTRVIRLENGRVAADEPIAPPA